MPIETLVELAPEIVIVDNEKSKMPVLAYAVPRHPAL